jgi:DNA (cytosine-5)-methyltransferase 1
LIEQFIKCRSRADLKMSNLKAVDLFAGCGGLSQGLKDAGFHVLAAVEIDKRARETYSLNHPEIPFFGSDIRNITSADLLSSLNLEPGELDLLAGCPPCQGFSSMRRRNGPKEIFDQRNDLIDDFGRLATEIRPKLIMMENVPSIVKFPKFQNLVSELEKAGYSVRYEVLDVALYGVPQRRKRLILSANLNGNAVLARPQLAPVSVRAAIQNLPTAGISGDPVHDFPSRRSSKVQQIIAHIPKDGGSRKSLPENMQLGCHKRGNGFNDVYGRMRWDDVSPTITSGCTNPSKGRFIHPEQNRAITLREAAILQGFPSNYKFDVSHGKEAISLMIGNALPPPFISSHAIAMAESIDENDK